MLRVLSIALGISVVVAGTLYYKKTQFQAVRIEQQIQPIPGFSLTNQRDEPFNSTDLKGQIWVAHFMFTTCQGPCPLMTKKITKLHSELADTAPFHLVSMTMNPDHDDATALTEYSERFGGDNNWSLLKGPIEEIVEIARQIFRVPADKDPNLHSTLFVLIDHEQKIRGYFDSADPERMAELKSTIEKITEDQKNQPVS